MPDASHFSLFLVAAFALALTPGPAVLYVVTRTVSQGRAAGLVSCLGVALGGSVHVLAAALGLSAVLATSAVAFGVVKYAGAAYLLWLGVQKLARPSHRASAESTARQPLLRILREGVVVNVLNPKTALFFLAFLPQFVAPERGSVAVQLSLLGSLFVLIAFCTDSTWALLAAGAGSWLKGRPGFLSCERYVTGSVYLGLGFASALSGSGRK